MQRFGVAVVALYDAFLATVNDTEARIIRLEERYTYLQEHVAEQDRVILGLTEELERMRQEIALVRSSGPTAAGGEDSPANERPPHY